ncbi:hypothetical protein ACJH6J_30260, partial [Mycobacterium sp. SMC-18]|uniref:hypothetical protein n=1 Tax=Mycobacterium sp. SMC-18 TaxID=3381629 RepID=UPI003875E290
GYRRLDVPAAMDPSFPKEELSRHAGVDHAGRNNTSRATRRRRHGDMSRILLALRAEGPDVADVYRDNC